MSWAGNPTSNQQLAGWWRRAGATVIDGILLSILGGIVRGAAGTGAYYGVSFVAGLLYASLLIAYRTQTLGMSAVGTRCVDANTGAPISVGRAFGRSLVSELLGITVIGGILDVLWPLWDPRNQTLHDKAVNTLVVMSRSTTIAAPPYPQAGPGTGAWGAPPQQPSGWAGAPSQPGGWSDSPAPSSGGWTDSPAPSSPPQGGGWSEAPAPQGGGWAGTPQPPQTGWSPESSGGWQSAPQAGGTPPPGPAAPPPPAPGGWQPAPPAPSGWQATPAQAPVPPAPPEQSVPAAWYPDPAGSGQERWWDGRSWTDHLRASS